MAAVDTTALMARSVRDEQRSMRRAQARDALSFAGWVAVSVGSAAVAASELLRRSRR